MKEKSFIKSKSKIHLENPEKNRNLAELASEKASPFVYQVISSTSSFDSRDCLRFFTLGCLGNAKSSQAKIAAFMNTLAKVQKPDFILILGDNFNDWGVESAFDFAFTSHFYNVYTNEAKVPNIANIPCFVILGNHDENLHYAKLPHQESGIKRGMHQVAHSYLGCVDTKYPTIESKIELYAKNILDIDLLPSWNMPNRFYSLIFNDTQLFCIDSNSYVKDFLASKMKIKLRGEYLNQASWLAHYVGKANAENKKTILALHHPLITLNKRFIQSDLSLYLNDEEIKMLQEMFKISDKDISHVTYDEMIKRVLFSQKIIFNLTLSAHDHAIYYFNNTNGNHSNSEMIDYPLCHLTSGGGGGSLPESLEWALHQEMGCFLEQHGFNEIVSTFNSDKIFFNIYTATSILKFENNGCAPLRTFSKEIPELEQKEIQQFCHIVITALQDYFQLLNDHETINREKKYSGKNFFKRKKINHVDEDSKCARKILAYLNHATADDLITTINKVYTILKSQNGIARKNQSGNSLIEILNKKLKEHYQDVSVNIENLSKKIKENK